MGWLGTALITAGNIWLAKRHSNAFLLIVMGNICWLIAGILAARTDMMALASISIVIHSRNYIHWAQNDFRNQTKS